MPAPTRRHGDDDEGTVSTWTRWALYVHDHPGATYEAVLVEGNANQVPDVFHPNTRYVQVTIKTPGAPDVIECRPIKVTAWDYNATRSNGKKGDWADVPPDKWTEEDWNGNRTACLGRALRQAGYPNTLAELQLVRNWTGAPTPLVPATPATSPAAAPQAARGATNPAPNPSARETAAQSDLDAAQAQVRERLNELTGPAKAAAARELRDAGIPNPMRVESVADCDTALRIIAGVAAGLEPAEPSPPADPAAPPKTEDEEPF